MTSDRQLIANLLQSLVLELKHLGEWQASPPSPKQLASELPFCVDTLTFYQWLQWVFVAKMQWLIDHKQPLPSVCAITPAAVEVIKPSDNTGHLLALIAALDAAISAAD